MPARCSSPPPATTTGRRSSVLLTGVPLPAKANLRLRWARAADRAADYLGVRNPLGDLPACPRPDRMLKPAAALTSDELGVPEAVRALAGQLGREDAALPAYVYDLGGLDTHAAAIRAALPAGVEFCSAVKANPDPAVLRVVAWHADSLEIASGGELAHVTAAVPGARLTFGGPGKTPAELSAAIRAGVARFHVEASTNCGNSAR